MKLNRVDHLNEYDEYDDELLEEILDEHDSH